MFEMLTELEMMKERFSKLLLGEDMSGSGKGVCTAVTISNAITNLYGNFIEHHKIIYYANTKCSLRHLISLFDLF